MTSSPGPRRCCLWSRGPGRGSRTQCRYGNRHYAWRGWVTSPSGDRGNRNQASALKHSYRVLHSLVPFLFFWWGNDGISFSRLVWICSFINYLYKYFRCEVYTYSILYIVQNVCVIGQANLLPFGGKLYCLFLLIFGKSRLSNIKAFMPSISDNRGCTVWLAYKHTMEQHVLRAFAALFFNIVVSNDL